MFIPLCLLPGYWIRVLLYKSLAVLAQSAVRGGSDRYDDTFLGVGTALEQRLASGAAGAIFLTFRRFL